MKIFVYIVLCLFTIISFLNVIEALSENNKEFILTAMAFTILGIIAIIFQSINL